MSKIYSDKWFRRFCKRRNTSLCKTSEAAQHTPVNLSATISKFHAKLLRVQRPSNFQLSDIANMDQNPLPFVIDDSNIYDNAGLKEVWYASAASGLDKCQCTVQLTLFADGKQHERPIIIFRGQGKRISKTERDGWDKRGHIMFQQKAQCDKAIIKERVASEWANVFTNPHSASSTRKILVADVHAAQQTNAVKTALHNQKTELVNVPQGCTSRIQPPDVCINRPFKQAVKCQHEAHMSENLQWYTEGKLTASDRRVLLIKWVGKAWQEVNQSKDTIIRSFKKCGISLDLSGSQHDDINIEGIPDYKMPSADEVIGDLVEFYLESDDSDDDVYDNNEDDEFEAEGHTTQ